MVFNTMEEEIFRSHGGDNVHGVADIILQLWGVKSDKDTLRAAVKVSQNMGREDRISLLTYVQEIHQLMGPSGLGLGVPIREVEWKHAGGLGWHLQVCGAYLTDAHQPSDQTLRGSMVARRIAGDPSMQLKKDQLQKHDISEMYEVRGSFVLLKSGGPSWDSIINLSGISKISWDGQALIFSGSQSTSVRTNTQLSNDEKQEILKGIFGSITTTTLRGSVRGVSNE